MRSIITTIDTRNCRWQCQQLTTCSTNKSFKCRSARCTCPTFSSLRNSYAITTLKCYYDQIIDTHFFLHFRVQYDFLTYLAKFQSITNIRSHSFVTFISENLRPPSLDLVPRLGSELEKMTSYAQKYLTGWNYNNNKYRILHEEHVQNFCCSLFDFL